MNCQILSQIPLKDEWLEELAEYVGWDITVTETTRFLKTKYNPYFRQMWGDFDWVKTNTPKGDIQCYATSRTGLRNVGIKGHIGMYDMVDRDGKHDFYIGVPTKLTAKTKLNGFKYNFTYLMLHEWSHGACQMRGIHDSTHAMCDQGRLKELVEEHNNHRDTQKKVKSLLERILELRGAILAKKRKTGYTGRLQPLVERKAKAVISDMKKLGYPVRMTEGYRTRERQDELYAQGRDWEGPIVTNARAGQSFHNYGVAVNFVFRNQGYDASKELWDMLGEIGKRHGFSWGGDWKKFKDRPHFELALGYKLSDFQTGKIDWTKYT